MLRTELVRKRKAKEELQAGRQSDGHAVTARVQPVERQGNDSDNLFVKTAAVASLNPVVLSRVPSIKPMSIIPQNGSKNPDRLLKQLGIDLSRPVLS